MADVPLNLTFSGQLAGVMRTATDVVTQGKKNPDTDLSHLSMHTQCSLFKVDNFGNDYVATVNGTVGAKRVALSIEINADNAAYVTPGQSLQPGDVNTGGSTTLQLPGDSTPRPSVVGPEAQEPATIVLNADRRSGTIDAWYADSGMSQKNTPSTEHVAGSWRCG